MYRVSYEDGKPSDEASHVREINVCTRSTIVREPKGIAINGIRKTFDGQVYGYGLRR